MVEVRWIEIKVFSEFRPSLLVGFLLFRVTIWLSRYRAKKFFDYRLPLI